jgi:hypothetical protein
VLTGVPDGGADGVAAAEEELDKPGRYVPRGAGDAHDLPRSHRRRGAHLLPWGWVGWRIGVERSAGVGFGYLLC